MTPTDRQLVEQCQAGDPRAWAVLVRRHRPRLLAIATRDFRLDHETAQDVVQESLLRAYAGLARLRDHDALGAWLGQLTRRACIDTLRRGRGCAPLLLLHEDLADPRASSEHERVLLATMLRVALDALPTASREVIERFFLRDQSYETIARELQISPGTVASRISRGLDRLRDACAA